MIPHNLCVSFKSFSIHCRFRLIQVTHSKGNLTCNSDDIGLCGIIGIVLIQHSLKYFLEGVQGQKHRVFASNPHRRSFSLKHSGSHKLFLYGVHREAHCMHQYLSDTGSSILPSLSTPIYTVCSICLC